MTEETIITIEDLKNKDSEFAQSMAHWNQSLKLATQLIQESAEVFKKLEKDLEKHSMPAWEIQEKYCDKAEDLINEIDNVF